MNLQNLSFETLNHKLPTKKVEAWKYTSLKSFSEVRWQIPEVENASDQITLNQPQQNHIQLNHEQMKNISEYLSSDFYNFVFVNGIIDATLSDEFPEWLKTEKLSAMDFSTLKSQETESSFLEIMQNNLRHKISVKLLPSVILDKPVQFVFISKGTDIFNQSYLDVNLAENSQAQVIVHELSIEDQSQTAQQSPCAFNLTGKINLQQAASLKWLQVQNENTIDYHFSRMEFALEDKAQLVSLDSALGAGLARHYVAVTFNGQDASAGIYGLCALKQNQHVDQYTYLHHVKGQNQSTQHYKNILGDESVAVFRGRVRIEPDAQKANSEQLNNNLLLSRKSQAISIPQLEIYADDVKAGHGSTMGQLNQEEIFYFLSRGISESQAIRMLSHGYALELVYKLENPEIENWLLRILNAQLERLIPHV